MLEQLFGWCPMKAKSGYRVATCVLIWELLLVLGLGLSFCTLPLKPEGGNVLASKLIARYSSSVARASIRHGENVTEVGVARPVFHYIEAVVIGGRQISLKRLAAICKHLNFAVADYAFQKPLVLAAPVVRCVRRRRNKVGNPLGPRLGANRFHIWNTYNGDLQPSFYVTSGAVSPVVKVYEHPLPICDKSEGPIEMQYRPLTRVKLLAQQVNTRITDSVLPENGSACCQSDNDADYPKNDCPNLSARKWLALPLFLICAGIGGISWGVFFAYINRRSWRAAWGLLAICAGSLTYIAGLNRIFVHEFVTVPQQFCLTRDNYRGTVIAIRRAQMSNILPMEKQTAIIGMLAEGSGIRQIERMTGVHRDTIMRLGVRIGQGCAGLLDSKMRDLPCRQLQFDEIWGFIGKKQRHIRPDDDSTKGDVWTFCAIDPETKLVPAYKVGKRDLATANAFVADVASRLRNRVQISADALRAYVDAIEMNFGADVDFAQIVKEYIHDDSIKPERQYSPSEIVVTEKKRICGFPDMRLASTSHIERLNGTTRLHMRRLTRLTYAFSKKRENFEAAVGLHFAYYNFVKNHSTKKMTPAMAAGIENDFWTVGDLIKAAA